MAIEQFEFIFGVLFLKELFVSANSASQALQAADVDLAAACTAVDELKAFVNRLRDDNEYSRLYSDASNRCSVLGIDFSASVGKKRKTILPASFRDSVLDSFVTRSSDALTSSTHLSATEQAKRALKVDFYLPVLDALTVSLNTRFNAESMTVIKNL